MGYLVGHSAACVDGCIDRRVTHSTACIDCRMADDDGHMAHDRCVVGNHNRLVQRHCHECNEPTSGKEQKEEQAFWNIAADVIAASAAWHNPQGLIEPREEPVHN